MSLRTDQTDKNSFWEKDAEAAQLLKTRMEKLRAEIGGSFEIVPRPKDLLKPDILPPFINSFMKLKPVHDLKESFERDLEKHENRHYKKAIDRLVDYIFTLEYGKYSLTMTADPIQHGSFSVRAKVEMNRLFKLSLMALPEWAAVFSHDFGGKPIDPDKGFWKWVIPERNANHLREHAPQTMYRLKFNLPTLNDRYMVNATERGLGEEYLNDWKVREYLLRARDLSVSIGVPDILCGDADRFVKIQDRFDPNASEQLKHAFELAQQTLDLFTKGNVISPPSKH